MEFWSVFFGSNDSRKAQTYLIFRFVCPPRLRCPLTRTGCDQRVGELSRPGEQHLVAAIPLHELEGPQP